MSTEAPLRKHQTRAELPPSRGGHPQRILPSNLRAIEQNLFMLLNAPGLWHLVDEFKGSSATASAMRNALWRRGAETRQRPSAMNPEFVQVWARWTHEVPTAVAPWEDTL